MGEKEITKRFETSAQDTVESIFDKFVFSFSKPVDPNEFSYAFMVGLMAMKNKMPKGEYIPAKFVMYMQETDQLIEIAFSNEAQSRIIQALAKLFEGDIEKCMTMINRTGLLLYVLNTDERFADYLTDGEVDENKISKHPIVVHTMAEFTISEFDGDFLDIDSFYDLVHHKSLG